MDYDLLGGWGCVGGCGVVLGEVELCGGGWGWLFWGGWGCVSGPKMLKDDILRIVSVLNIILQGGEKDLGYFPLIGCDVCSEWFMPIVGSISPLTSCSLQLPVCCRLEVIVGSM